MDKMMELIKALDELTKALQAFTSKTDTDYPDTFKTICNPENDEPKEDAAKEETTPEPLAVSFVQLRSRLAEISRSGHTAEIKELIAKFGADKLSAIAESDYAALLAEAEELV